MQTSVPGVGYASPAWTPDMTATRPPLPPTAAAPRRRGRPAAPPDADQHRRLLEAARRVFVRTGSFGASVELVAAEAGVAPEVVRLHFASVDAALERVMRDMGERLVAKLLVAVIDLDDAISALEAGLLAWRQWGEELGGPLLGRLRAELHLPGSPVARQYAITLDFLATNMAQLAVRFGRPRPNRVQMDALLTGLGHLGFRYHLDTPRDAASWKQTRDAMLRLAIGLLGSREDWSQALALADALHVDLEAGDSDSD